MQGADPRQKAQLPPGMRCISQRIHAASQAPAPPHGSSMRCSKHRHASAGGGERAPGCLRMTATVPSVMLSPMLGTATWMSASAAAEPLMPRASSQASSLPPASAAAAAHCGGAPAAAGAPAGRRRESGGSGRRRRAEPRPWAPPGRRRGPTSLQTRT